MTRNLRACLLVLLTFVSVSSAFSQDQYKVSGHVKGSDYDEGLPGVTISIKGQSKGTTTDFDGNYSLNVNEKDVLVYSFIGYLTQEMAVNGRTVINVELPQDIQKLEEVVIVGYGEQKKTSLTSAIVTIDPEELEDIPTANLAQTLVGKLPGVQVSRNGTGVPGTPSPLVIRAESASGNIQRQVVYVIDGVIYTGEQDGTGPTGDEIFNRLDPSEIESISILKDAAAAVYGARGAGGVVLVKTKRGQAGKTRVNYSGSFGIGQPTQIPDMLSGIEHAKMWNEKVDQAIRLSTYRSTTLRERNKFTDEELEIIKGRDYDWLDGLYKAAVIQKHSLNVSGGSERVRYFVAGNYYHETGNFDDLWFRRYGIRSNIEADLTENLLLTMGINFSEGVRKNPSYGGGSDDGTLRGWYQRPLTAPKWLNPRVDGMPVDINDSWNPHGLLQSGSSNLNHSNNTNINTRLSYDLPFIDGLKLGSQLSYNLNTSTGTRYNQNYEVYEFEVVEGVSRDKMIFTDVPTGETRLVANDEKLSESFQKGINYQWNASISYAKTISKHSLNALIVYEQSDGESKFLTMTQTGAEVRGYPYTWAYSAESIINRGDYDQTGRWGVVGRLNYDYDGKYLFESAFRGEASSKFAKEERFGFFPSVSAGWVMSDEVFFSDNVSFIDFFKLRMSVGVVGNDNTRPYEHQVAFIPNAQANGPIYGDGNGALSGTIQARRDGFTVPSRTWSKTLNNNFGVDLRILDNRMNFGFEYYYNRTYDAYDRNRNYPYVIGNNDALFENYRISMSTGLEFSLGWSDDIGKDFGYSIDGNFTKRRSRPIRLYQNPAVLGTYVDELKNDDSNQPGYTALGIIRDEMHLAEVEQLYPNQPRNSDGQLMVDGFPLEPGMLYYKDVGGPDYSREPDGIIDGNDASIIAEYTTPPYSYGFTLGARYKGFKVSASFGGVFGHKEFVEKTEQVTPEIGENVFAWWSDYWTPENTDASLPRPYEYGWAEQVSTFWMRNGHTLRLNFVNISYQMPKDLSNKLRLESWRMYISSNNLWTIISPFDYKDPAISKGYDYPLVRTISLGTNFSF
ncbi:MAG: TonB-dependent receptor [Cyclobacteriaceae bacterium]